MSGKVSHIMVCIDLTSEIRIGAKNIRIVQERHGASISNGSNRQGRKAHIQRIKAQKARAHNQSTITARTARNSEERNAYSSRRFTYKAHIIRHSSAMCSPAQMNAQVQIQSSTARFA